MNKRDSKESVAQLKLLRSGQELFTMRRQVLESVAQNRQVYYRTLLKGIQQPEQLMQRSRNQHFETERMVIAKTTLGAQKRVDERFAQAQRDYSRNTASNGFFTTKVDFKATLRDKPCSSFRPVST